MDKNNIKYNIKNAQGKRLIERNILEYSEEITKILTQNPTILKELLDSLEITEVDFWHYISLDPKANVTFYDAALSVAQKLSLEKGGFKNSNF